MATMDAKVKLINHLKSGEATVESVEKILNQEPRLSLDFSMPCCYNRDTGNNEKMSPLMVACRNGQTDIVKLLIGRGADIDRTTHERSDCYSALTTAVFYKHVNVVKTLLEYGAKVNLRGNDKTPLLIACESNSTRIAEMLLSKVENEGEIFSAYKLAMETKRDEIVELLLKNAQADAMKLMYAIEKGTLKEVELKTRLPFINYCLNGGQSPLMVASSCGHSAIVELLLKSGADIDLQNKWGVSALMTAAYQCQHETVKLLLEKSANVNLKDTNNNSALLHLIRGDNREHFLEVLELLLEHGADVQVKSNDKTSPLSYVITEKLPSKAVKMLLEKNARTDVLLYGSLPVLHTAVRKGDPEVVKLLLEHGVPIDLQDNDGKSALMIACKEGHTEISKLLINKGAQVNLVSNNNAYALFLASNFLLNNHYPPVPKWITGNEFLAHLEVIELLLEQGANANLIIHYDIDTPLVRLHRFNRQFPHVISSEKLPKLTELLIHGGEEPVVEQSSEDSVDSADDNNEKDDFSEQSSRPTATVSKAEIEANRQYHSDDDDHSEDSEDENAVEKIEDAVKKNENISRKLAHGILVGPTGSGKSSLMDRLLDKLPKKEFSSSTGVSEPVVVVDIDIDNPSTFHSVTVMGHNTWTETKYDLSLLRQIDDGVVTSQTDNTATSQSDSTSTSPPPAKKAKTKSETAVAVSTSHQKSLPNSDESDSISPVPPTPATKPKALPTAKIVRHAIKKFGGYKKLKRFLKKSFSLYLRDTGGQVEFQEMIPLLIFGPSIVFFVFRLDLDFKKKFEVKYRKSAGESLNCYISSITTEEAFLQSLATVDAMDMSGEASVKTHKPLVFVIGTHRDKLGPSADKKIAELNEHLSSLTKNSGFRDLVQYADRRKGHVMFTVDNTSESDEDFKLIRSRVSNMIRDRQEFIIEYPIRYLLFCLELQNSERSVLSLYECKIMAAKCGIEEDQLVNLLQFLHLRIGIIRYFDKDGVRHIVIKEPQVLFNNVTDLIIKTFSCEALTNAEAEDFEKKGILTASVLATALKNLGDITPEEFLQLLVHLRITAPFSTSDNPSQEKRYFFPSVLNHVPESTEEPSTEILPLAVTFKHGHCPKGLFGVLVTHLMTPDLNEGATSHTTTFTLMQGKIFKDQVSFEVHSPGVHDEMALKLHPSHLEIKLFPEHSEDRCTSITEVCSNVRQIVETSIHHSLQDLHYSESKVAPATCFRCEDCSELHEVEIGKHLVKMYCKKTHTTQSIPDQGKWWYREALTSDSVKRFLRRLPSQQIKEVGCCLGLRDSYMSTVDELITSWLREGQDTASWEHLVTALDRTGHKEIASSISRELDLTVSDDPVTTKTTSVTLTHSAVRKFLKPLSNTQLREVGLELGLRWPRLKKMKENCMLDDMLESWLREDDDVTETSGRPSWLSLVKALEEAGYKGVATKIKQNMMS